MSWLGNLMARRRRVDQPGSFVADVQFDRNEELRPERLGPGVDDVDPDDVAHVDPWRPKRTLGPISQD